MYIHQCSVQDIIILTFSILLVGSHHQQQRRPFQSSFRLQPPGRSNLLRSRRELRLARPSTGGRSGICDKYLVTAVLNVVLFVMVDILRGKVFHILGPTTPNDDSQLERASCVESVRSAGTFTFIPRLSLLIVVRFKSFGIMLLIIFQTVMIMKRSRRRCRLISPRILRRQWQVQSLRPSTLEVNNLYTSYLPARQGAIMVFGILDDF